MHIFLQGNPAVNAFVASVLAVALMLASFSLFEPVVTHGQVDSNDFEVTQEIQSELSFLTQPGDVTMDDTISGLTGGNTFGTSTFNITTNDPDGYTVELRFASETAMVGENLNSNIPNYAPASAGDPDFDFDLDNGQNGDAAFAYTVVGETNADDIDSRFNDDGSANCNTGSGTLQGHCWYGTADATNLVQIINADSATAGTGATSSLVFQVGVASNPSPALETGFYTATGTLTATVN